MSRDELYDLAGWAAVAGVVAVWDLLVTRRGRTSLSRTVWRLLDRPLAGPVTAGVVAGVAWHLAHPPDIWRGLLDGPQ